MTAAMLVLEPIFEADLPPKQYAEEYGSGDLRLKSRGVLLGKLVDDRAQAVSHELRLRSHAQHIGAGLWRRTLSTLKRRSNRSTMPPRVS
jgi:hypothetical protein